MRHAYTISIAQFLVHDLEKTALFFVHIKKSVFLQKKQEL